MLCICYVISEWCTVHLLLTITNGPPQTGKKKKKNKKKKNKNKNRKRAAAVATAATTTIASRSFICQMQKYNLY